MSKGGPAEIGPDQPTVIMEAVTVPADRTVVAGEEILRWMEEVERTQRTAQMVQFVVESIRDNGTRWNNRWRFFREPDYSDAESVVAQFEAVLRVAQHAVGGTMNPEKLPPLLKGCIELTHDTAQVQSMPPEEFSEEPAEPLGFPTDPEMAILAPRTSASEAVSAAMDTPNNELPPTRGARGKLLRLLRWPWTRQQGK